MGRVFAPMHRRTLLQFPAMLAAASGFTGADWRDIQNGLVIPDEGYCDQPYVVLNPDGSWLCVMTTGPGHEGQGGQHVVATISRDYGRTWSGLIPIEPGDGPEASWAMPLAAPHGRVYVFYTYNRDNIREVKSNSPSNARRVDTLGVYAYSYSDDGGRTWSRDRYEIPMRRMRIDRENFEDGRILFFWGVGKPIISKGSAYLGFAKVGRWGNPGTMIESQGVFLKSANLLTERDPSRHTWDLLPEGDEGLRAPKGPVSDEANLVALSNGTLYCTYRTIDGYLCHAYSADEGRSWTPPAYATYAPGGRRMKHPRAAIFVKKFSNGKYLLWYHNLGGEAVHLIPNWQYYQERNPGWITGGIERDGKMHWSEPEILLYDRDPKTRISYPDFVEQDGRFWVTATQKTVARVHPIDLTLLDGLWEQHERKHVPDRGLAAEYPRAAGQTKLMPRLGDLREGGGFTLDCWINLKELTAGQVLLDSRDSNGKGIALTTSEQFSLRLTLSDGERSSEWQSDPGTHPGTLAVNRWMHAAVIVEAGPKLILWVVNGVLNDGGRIRQYGWGRFDPAMAQADGLDQVKIAPTLVGQLALLRIWNRPLRVSEAVGIWRAEKDRYESNGNH